MKAKKEKISMVKWGSMSLFLVIVIGGIYLFFKYNKQKVEEQNIDPNVSRGNGVQVSDRVSSNDSTTGDVDVSDWQSIIDDKYGYRIKYPPQLDFEKIDESGSYLNFIRFLANPQKTKSHGIAMGVRDTTLEDEVSLIKKEVLEKGEARLVSEENFTYKGLNAVRLVFVPLERAEYYEYLENREVVIFNNGTFSYSISTVPEQMQDVLDNFEFVVRTQ